MKGKAIVLVAAMGVALVMASGVALAQTISCHVGQPCYGTEQNDT